MLIKNNAYSNEYDLEDLLRRISSEEGVYLLKLKDIFSNDFLINQLRMVARPT